MMRIDLSATHVVCSQQKRSAGFTLFEIGVAASILAILTTVLAQRLVFYQEQAERVAVDAVVANMRTGLSMAVAGLHINNRGGEVAGLAGQNPIIWLEGMPPNYRGEYYSPGSGEIPPGAWYFDRSTRNLVYLFAKGKTFSSVASERIYLKVILQHSPTDASESSRASAGKANVVLVQVNG